MDNEELELVLSEVARLVDKTKSELISSSAEADEGVSSEHLRAYSKGELVAELVFLNFTGRWRKRLAWYEE